MRNGALITQFPGVTWFVDCTIPGISEILVARRHHAERSIGALICPTTGGKFLSPANPLAIRMLGQFLSVEIQASEWSSSLTIAGEQGPLRCHSPALTLNVLPASATSATGMDRRSLRVFYVARHHHGQRSRV